MKHYKIFMAVLMVAAFASCKKADVIITDPSLVTDGTKTQKLVKIEATDGTYTETFTYNADGRLAKWNNGYFMINYSYAASPFGYDLYTPNAPQKAYDIADVTMNNGKATRFLYRRVNPDGTVMWADTTTQQYDAAGYQVQKAYGDYNYTAIITGGNTTRLTVMNIRTGKLNYETTAEYYADKPNKTNINIFEYGFFDHILSDKEQFGKKSNNLLKKLTDVGTNTYVYDFTYNLDANGYINTYTVVYTVNGGAPKATTYKFSYL